VLLWCPGLLCSSIVIPGTNTDPPHPENRLEPTDRRYPAASPRNPEIVCSATELVLIRSFVELLAVWDEENRRSDY
jgi:hypothetical protein